ncbi:MULTISPECIES: hypothetical protein [Acinetobacter]|uniref:hypothetical protein n=1 Tax=Acinetobacter TaxID=469 RepID=UPI0012664B6C|nr:MULTISPECIES: hypothetical protein [Acinetobacter]MDM1274019.1 hypothetical protein [Acinetobacter indicus]QFS17041.1 hypothetical protein FHP22_05635 [Acinetobacter indicus]
MKKIILLGLLGFVLAGCSSQAIIDNMATAKTNVSDFDGSKQIYTQPMYVFATTGFHAAPISLGAKWIDKVQDFISVDVEIRGEYVNVEKLYLNIDGNIQEYKAIQALTKLSTPDPRTFAQKTSKKSFMVPVTDIEKIKTANSVKIKVTTLSDGYFEGVVIAQGRQSPGAKSLINVIDQIQK